MSPGLPGAHTMAHHVAVRIDWLIAPIEAGDRIVQYRRSKVRIALRIDQEVVA